MQNKIMFELLLFTVWISWYTQTSWMDREGCDYPAHLCCPHDPWQFFTRHSSIDNPIIKESNHMYIRTVHVFVKNNHRMIVRIISFMHTCIIVLCVKFSWGIITYVSVWKFDSNSFKLSDSGNDTFRFISLLWWYTTISYLSGRQSKLSAPRCCGPPDDNPTGGPQHLRADSFDCCPERYEIVVLLPNSYFSRNCFLLIINKYW